MVDKNQGKLDPLLHRDLRGVKEIAFTFIVVFAAHQPHLLEVSLDCRIVIPAVFMSKTNALHPVHAQYAMHDKVSIKGNVDARELPPVSGTKAVRSAGCSFACNIEDWDKTDMLNLRIWVAFRAIVIRPIKLGNICNLRTVIRECTYVKIDPLG